MKKATSYLKSETLKKIDCPECKKPMNKSGFDTKRYYCVKCNKTRYPDEEK